MLLPQSFLLPASNDRVKTLIHKLTTLKSKLYVVRKKETLQLLEANPYFLIYTW